MIHEQNIPVWKATFSSQPCRMVDGVERRRMGGIRRAFLRTRSSSMSRAEDQGGGTGWIREEMICGGVAARVTDSSFRFPPDLSPLPRKQFACLKMDARMELGRHQAELLNETRRRIEPRECHNYQGSPPSLPLSTLRWLSSSCREECVYIYIKREREKERDNFGI